MEPDNVSDFVRIIEGGGNAAIVVAAVFLYRAVKSLVRIETFMATLFEVLLRTDGIQLRESDQKLLREMRAEMSSHRKQGGFIMKRLLITIALLLGLGSAVAAFAQVAPDAMKVTWTNATQDVNGNALPAAPDPKSLKTNRVHRKFADDCETNFGPVSAVTEVINVPADVTMVLFENIPPGKHCVRVRHITADDTLSDWSAIISKVTQSPIPAKPGPPTITVE